MSDPRMVAVVSEGPTDKIVIEAAITNLLGTTPYVLKHLHPEESRPFGPLKTGWGGVYHWCRQASVRAGGRLRGDILFHTYDVLILHLDADVARKRYSDFQIDYPVEDLPCHQPCPPPENTTDNLRAVLLAWAGETALPPKTVLCTPSMNIEAWVLCALFPRHAIVLAGNLECQPNVEDVLRNMPLDTRLRKKKKEYELRAGGIAAGWPHVRRICTEAERFSNDIETVLGP